MLWFTGSSTEGLPFIHDSFRANPKAVHHKPRRHHQHQHHHHHHQQQQQQPQQPSNNNNHTTTITNGTSTPRAVNPKDISREVLESESFRLPAVEAGIPSNGQLTSRSVGKGESVKDPVSFTTYMHRYKACARLKGFSPARVYCSTRMRSHPTDNHHHHHDTDHTPPIPSPKDPLTPTTITQSNLHASGSPPKPDPPQSEASPPQLPDLAPQDSATQANGTDALEKQIDEKLKQDSSQDDGMVHPHRHGDRHHPRGRGKGKRTRGGGGGSGGVTARGGGQGGGRPLGDIVNPRRLQELLAHEDDRTLPYTYYRTAVDKEEARLEDADIQSLE